MVRRGWDPKTFLSILAVECPSPVTVMSEQPSLGRRRVWPSSANQVMVWRETA